MSSPRREPAARKRRCGCGSGIPVEAGMPCGRCRYGLTARERLVATSVAAGWDPRQIAEQLGVAESTIRSQLKAVYVKVGVHSAADLTVAMAAEFVAEPAAIGVA